MTIYRRGLSLIFGVLALMYACDFFSRLTAGENSFAALKFTACAILTWEAISVYKETWQIEEADRIFTIWKNGKIRFQGRRIDLTLIDSDKGNYFLTPAKGRTVKVPKKAANDALLKLISAVDQPKT